MVFKQTKTSKPNNQVSVCFETNPLPLPPLLSHSCRNTPRMMPSPDALSNAVAPKSAKNLKTKTAFINLNQLWPSPLYLSIIFSIKRFFFRRFFNRPEPRGGIWGGGRGTWLNDPPIYTLLQTAVRRRESNRRDLTRTMRKKPSTAQTRLSAGLANKYHDSDYLNPLMAIGNYSYQFLICCPRDCVSRHNGGTSVPPLNPSESLVLSEHYRL